MLRSGTANAHLSWMSSCHAPRYLYVTLAEPSVSPHKGSSALRASGEAAGLGLVGRRLGPSASSYSVDLGEELLLLLLAPLLHKGAKGGVLGVLIRHHPHA